MNKNTFSVLSALFLLTCCSVEEQTNPEQVVISSPPSPLYPQQLATGTVLKKRHLRHNREEYHIRLANGREVNFTVDSPAHYQVGDEVILPIE